MAGGSSRRMGIDKIFADIGGSTVIERTISAFLECNSVNDIIVVINEKNLQRIEELISEINGKEKIQICTGGESRRD